MLTDIHHICKPVNLNMHLVKIKVMLNDSAIKSTFTVNGKLIEDVYSYVYLGETVTREENLLPEIKRRIALGWEAFSKVANILTSKKNVNKLREPSTPLKPINTEPTKTTEPTNNADATKTIEATKNMDKKKNTEATHVMDSTMSTEAIKTMTIEQAAKRRRTFIDWLKKYFWQGQQLQQQEEANMKAELNHESLKLSLLARYRRILGVLLPALLIHFIYWSTFISYGRWHLFGEHYLMMVTIVFAAIIAGMTSEGGGAVAFPVMTLALGISTSVARDFALLIQSVGMSAAAFSILFQRIQIEWRSLTYCFLGGSAGTILGFHFIDPHLTPPQKKILFVSIWFSFAFALFLLNRHHKRKTFPQIPNSNAWKIVVLVVTGLAGGVFTSFSGSGIDICSFSMLTLLFRVSEKVATPTSVVLMASISIIGAYWRACVMREMDIEVWNNFAVCVPIVCIMAPLGATLGSHFHRQVLAALVYILDIVALVSALIIIPMTMTLWVIAGVTVAVGGIFFFIVSKIGERLLPVNDKKTSNNSSNNNIDSGA